MKIRLITGLGRPFITITQNGRRQIDFRLLKRWRGPFREFFKTDVSFYHHGWTKTRYIWIGPIFCAWSKGLTSPERRNHLHLIEP